MESEYFDCKICGGKRYKVLLDHSNIRFSCYGFDKNIIQCCGCNTIQLFPMWSEADLSSLYSIYRSKKDFPNQKRVANIYRELGNEIGSPLKKRILEIGCGGCDNLFFWRGKGYNIIGVDRNPRYEKKDTIIKCNFEEYKDEKGFDFIYGMHVLEHVEDPLNFIRKVKNLLNPGGNFLFEIPNSNDPLLTLYHNEKFNSFYWDPHHLYFYDEVTVHNLFGLVKGIKFDIRLKQRYGLVNHLRWFIFGKPSSVNFKIPLFDNIYFAFLRRIFKKTDTIVITGGLK